MSDVAERIANMDAMGVDIQLISASLVHQGLEWADAQTSLRLARTTNDWIAKAVAAHPTRLIGLGTLPLHVPSLAVGELERCMRELALKGVAISTTAAGMELGDAALRPFWEKAEALGAVVYIHPGGNRDRRFKRFPLEQRRPGVRGSHGDLVADVRRRARAVPETQDLHLPRRRLHAVLHGPHRPQLRREGQYPRQHEKPPIDYLRMLYFDSCVYERPVLQHLVDKVGADRVLLGSDYPVGEAKPIEFVTGTEALSSAQKEQIVATNAAALLGLAGSYQRRQSFIGTSNPKPH